MDINVCPRCGSTSLDREYRASAVFLNVKTVKKYPLDTYKCRECGYEGVCPVIDKSDLEDFRKQLKESKEN